MPTSITGASLTTSTGSAEVGLVDAAASAPAAWTLAGGTIGRPLTAGRTAAWLLDLDLGGRPVRVATREVAVESRESGGERVYVGGLSELDVPVGADTVTVTVRADRPEAWAELRRVVGPLRGRRFVLRRVYDLQVLEDAYVALQGVVEAATYGSPGDPLALVLTLSRATRELSLEIVPSAAIVSRETWPVRPAYPQDENVNGQPYPWIVGCPGALVTATATGLPAPATPGLLVEGLAHPTSRLLVAGHRVDATEVVVWDMSTAPPASEYRTVQVVEDLLGREVSYVDFVGSALAATEGHVYMVGWDRDYGGGLPGVTGLGDLLIAGARRYSRAVHDWAAMEAARGRLNRYRLDACVNVAGLRWDDWLSANVLGTFELREVHGPRGLYYVERVWELSGPARGRITTDPSASGGHIARRVSAIEEQDEELANEITVFFAPRGATAGAWGHRVSFSPRRGEYIAGDADAQDYPDLRCATSRQLYGPLQLAIETAIIHDRASATTLGRVKVAKHALPWQTAAYRGGGELLDYREGELVELYDRLDGADFRGEAGVVDLVTIHDDGTAELQIRVPTDPLRAPTVTA